MNEVPAVSMHSGKVQNDGGGTSAPGQAHLPPGAWPGVPADSHGWWSGEGHEDIVAGPLPALQKLAGRFADSLSATERLAFLRATVARDQPIAGDDLVWLLDYAEGRANRDRVVLAGLEAFYLHMKNAVTGNGSKQEETT